MTTLSLKSVQLNGTAKDKEDAIRQAGALLMNAGYVSEGYIPGMLEREQTMSTYMGNGVAIPHGMHDSREFITETGISVLQLPDGVEWEDGETAYLVIGIAANNDDHMTILMNLADAIEEEEDAAELIALTDAEEMIARLSATPEDVG